MYAASPTDLRLGDPFAPQRLGKFRFRPGKALKRAIHFTPKSFTLKRIMGALGSITATIATGGLGPIIAPKIVSANSKAMEMLGIGVTAIAAVAGGVVLGPAIASSLGPTLSSAATMLGKGVESLTTFFSFFNRQTPPVQQGLAQMLTPEQIAGIERGTFDPTPLIQSVTGEARAPSGAYGGTVTLPGSAEAAAFGPSVAPAGAPLTAGTDWTTIALFGVGAVAVVALLLQTRK